VHAGLQPGAGERKGLSRALQRRTAYTLALLFVALVVLANVVAALWERPKARFQRSSLTTSPAGHRAFYELLEDAGFALRRNHAVPSPEAAGDGAFFILAPQQFLLRRDPRYLTDLADWAAEGHTLLIAFGESFTFGSRLLARQGSRDDDTQDEGDPERELRRTLRRMGVWGEADRPVFDALALDLELEGGPLHDGDGEAELTAEPDGTPAEALVEGCRTLALEPGAYFVGPALQRASATVWAGDKAFLVEFRRGLGRIVLLADVSMIDNERILEADNGPLAFHVAWRYGRKGIVFDEYYHGLHQRPSVVRLLCSFPLSVVSASLLLCVAGFILGRWRHFGRPAAEEPPSRRSKAEHVRAMAALFRRCRKTRLTLRQLVGGLTRELADAYGLRAAGSPAEVVERLRARSCPGAAAMAQALERADAALASGAALSERRLLKLYDDLWNPARKAIDAASESTV